MYDYINGKFTYKTSSAKGCFVTVEACGVGYRFEVMERDFVNLPDVKDMILRLKKTVLPADVKCIIADPVNLKISKPISIVVYGTTVICADFTYAIDSGNYVVFCNETIANKIYEMDSLSAVTYIEGYIPEESRNKDSLAASQIPEDVKEIEVEENLEEPSEGHCCDACVSEAKKYEEYCGPKESNPHCNPSECCEDCGEETCGGCNDRDCSDFGCENCDCCESNEDLPLEYHITIADVAAMCERLKIDISVNIPGASSRYNR